MTQKIFILEDDPGFGTFLKKWLEKKGFHAVLATTLQQARQKFLSEKFDLILSDLRLPDGDGLMFLSWIQEQKEAVPFILMTSYGEIQNAVSAMKMGAFDYLEKPINPTLLQEKIEQALSPVKTPDKPATVSTNSVKSKAITGKSTEARELDRQLQKVAPTLLSVLILGESGTGKEYTARRIHEYSKRSDKPFLAVDCGSLSRELAPSELFGHLKGSFTSAVADKKGVFEQANHGTVFLDEIGNLSYDVQIQLLRCLQERKIRPVGSAVDIPVDVRIIVATNENLPDAIAQGKFREDLYHRLNEFSLTVPPLRKRKEDIEQFALHFLEEANLELDKNIRSFSAEALDILKNYHWSGNLRELRNVIRRAALFTEGNEIHPADLPLLTQTLEKEENFALRPGSNEDQKEQILKALKWADGNKSLAAKILKVDRKTLYNRMHQLGIDL
ncbi:MAG: sigma-54 dependent transcriptional regulator [Bacteroidales bacterium]|nr:sigma-54 dependent transcriptional regulator [Bacteroidales bacterium]